MLNFVKEIKIWCLRLPYFCESCQVKSPRLLRATDWHYCHSLQGLNRNRARILQDEQNAGRLDCYEQETQAGLAAGTEADFGRLFVLFFTQAREWLPPSLPGRGPRSRSPPKPPPARSPRSPPDARRARRLARSCHAAPGRRFASPSTSPSNSSAFASSSMGPMTAWFHAEFRTPFAVPARKS